MFCMLNDKNKKKTLNDMVYNGCITSSCNLHDNGVNVLSVPTQTDKKSERALEG